VPFLLRWPGRVAAGAVDDRLVTHIDVVPTILAATGVSQSHVSLDGRDILSGYTRQRALTEYWNDANNNPNIPTRASIRTTAFRYAEFYDNANPANVTFREYYNLRPTRTSWSTSWPTASPPTTPTPPPSPRPSARPGSAWAPVAHEG
jgi:arylsulfatase A-like enzyme